MVEINIVAIDILGWCIYGAQTSEMAMFSVAEKENSVVTHAPVLLCHQDMHNHNESHQHIIAW